MKSNKLNRILLIGPLPIKEDVVGGAKVSFKNMVDQLQNEVDIDILVINTSRPLRGLNTIRRNIANFSKTIQVIFKLIKQITNVNLVIWNVSPSGMLSVGPIIWLICKYYRKPLIVRVFGGALDIKLENINYIQKKLGYMTILRSSSLLLQSKYLVDKLKGLNNVSWYPTTRNLEAESILIKRNCKRFLFIGQIKKEKGIDDILSVASKFKDKINITICGPKTHGYDVCKLHKDENIDYIGLVEPSKIKNILKNHDAFLFPSYYENEGYSGAVIEALQMGLPVITTNWNALPEIVEDGISGIIIEPRNIMELEAAIEKLINDQLYYQHLASGALLRGKFFNSNSALDRINKLIKKHCG